MARNSEKAMTALARWRKAKEAEEGLDTKSERRPYLGKYFVVLSCELMLIFFRIFKAIFYENQNFNTEKENEKLLKF